MITAARIEALRELGGTGWLTALRAPAIAKLAAQDRPLQLSLFDQQDLAEISHPDYPGERLLACRNPLLATERARKRTALLAATEAMLAPITAALTEGRLVGADQIGLRVGKVVNKFKMAKHFDLAITDTTLSIERKTAQIEAEAHLDGIYVIRTSMPTETLDAPGVVTAYKNLAHVERDFRSIKADDFGPAPYPPRPRRPGPFPRAAVHAGLLPGLEPTSGLGRTDLQRRAPTGPGQPRRPLHPGRDQRRPAHHHRQRTRARIPRPARAPDHPARNDIRYGDTAAVIPTLSEPTPTQRRAFELLRNHSPSSRQSTRTRKPRTPCSTGASVDPGAVTSA
jgi:hypothetical protein